MKIIKGNQTYNLQDLGIIINSYIITSPNPIHEREKIDDRDGFIDLGTTYDGRVITVKLTILPVDRHDFALLRNKVFRILDSRESFYLVHEEEGKRWTVKYNSPFSFSRVENIGETTIELISSSAYAESVGTTLDELTFESEKWQVGQGLISDDLSYIHSTPTFSIYNAGDIMVDPRQYNLKITLKGISTGLQIINHTTGDTYAYNGVLNEGDTLVLDGVRTLKNGDSDFKNTNKKLLTIAPGWNEFEVTGVTDFEIKFDFRFYYI